MRRLLLITALAWVGTCAPAQGQQATQPEPPPQLGDHIEPTSALAREHQFHASVAGRVLRHDGKPAVGATVIVFGYQPYYWAMPLARAATDADGRYRCEDVSGRGRSLLWVVAPEGTPFRRTSTPLTMVSGETTQLRPVVLPEPPKDAPAETTFRATLLAANGQPVPGAMIRLASSGDRFDPSCFALTDMEGRVEIPVRTGTPEQARVFYARNRLEIDHESGAESLAGEGRALKLDLTGKRTIQCDRITWAEPKASGADGVEFAWQLADAWRPCVEDRAPADHGAYGDSWPTIRATGTGRLPRLVSQARQVTFDDDVAMRLQVVDDLGESVASRIDICSSTLGARFQETLLQTLSTGADGSLQLLGPRDSDAILYVYAQGHRPTRARWRSGAPLEIVLQRRTAKLHFEIGDAESSIFVRRAGTFDLAAVAYPKQGPLELQLAPGSYEVTRYQKGPAAAAMQVNLKAAATTKLALREDQRPTIEVTLPASPNPEGWWAYGSRQAVGGMVANRAMWTQRGGAMPTRALVAEIEPSKDGKLLLRFPTSGRYTLLLGHKEFQHRLLREVHVAFGHSYSIAVAGLTGVLTGTIDPFPDGWQSGMAIDGVAGPRVWLEPRNNSAFGTLVTLPSAAKFELTDLPTGPMTLHHHLYETGLMRSVEGTWGGQAITLGETTAEAGRLARAKHGTLQVQVLARNGSAPAGILRVRDRMSESWQRVMAENSTLIYASDPIPTPPSARLANGIASIDKIQAGHLHFELLLDDGRTAFFARDVTPGELLKVQLKTLDLRR